MTEQEKFNAEVQMRLTKQDAKFELFMNELKQQREDMRRAQERHDADMKEMRQKHDADMKELREDIKGTLRHIQGLTIAAMVGIVAIAGATWAFMWSSTRATLPPTPPAQSTQIDQSRDSP